MVTLTLTLTVTVTVTVTVTLTVTVTVTVTVTRRDDDVDATRRWRWRDATATLTPSNHCEYCIEVYATYGLWSMLTMVLEVLEEKKVRGKWPVTFPEFGKQPFASPLSHGILWILSQTRYCFVLAFLPWKMQCSYIGIWII